MYVCIYIFSLFFGGYHPIYIESLRIIKNNINYQLIIGMLKLLDSYVSGHPIGVNDYDFTISSK